MLAAALTEDEVASTLLAVTEELLQATAGVVYLQDGDGRLRLVASRGVTHSLESLRVLPLDAPLPLSTAVVERCPIFISRHADLLEQYPNLSHTRVPLAHLQAIAALPLVQGDNVVGGFAVSFDEERHFDNEERRWLEAIAAQASVAADRARLYEAERRAREEAETLYRISEALNATRTDLETTVQRVTDEATRLTGAEFGAFFYNVLDAKGEAYLLYTLSGAPKEAFAKLGLPRNTPIFAPTFAGEGVVRLDDVKKDPRYGQMGPHHGMPPGHLPVTSYLAVPVVSPSGEVLGGLFFGHSQPGRFTAAHERMTKALATSAALAIENAKLLRTARAAEAHQKRIVDDLRETVRFNDLFVGVLAHDLRTPLAAMLTSAELLSSRLSSPDDRNAKPIGRLISSGHRMTRMIEQLLDFTRLRFGGGMSLDPRPMDLGPHARQIVDEMEGANPGWPITVETSGELLGTWDADRLSQLLSNLIGNALQHGSPEDGVRIRINGEAAGTVTIEIHNMGAIARERLPNVFEPLIGGERRRDKSRGLGLGLFITRAIARAHGGDVGVTSTAAAGTSFVVTLPREARPPAPAEVLPATLAAHATPAELERDPLYETEARFRMLVDAVKDYAIFMLDPTGRVATWNAGAKRINGYEASEIIGQHFSRFYPKEEILAGKCEKELELATREGRFEEEGWRLRKDGTTFWASVLITPVRDGSGDLVGFTKVTRDLTERRRLQEEQISLARAQEAIRLRDEFLALASHELKTPLTVLQIQLDSLNSHPRGADPKLETKLERAARSTDRLARLVGSLLDVSRIATGKFPLDVKPFDLGDVVGRVVDGLRPAATAAGCELSLTTAGPLDGVWDQLRTEQIVTNLLGNAIKYAPGAPIEMALQGADDTVTITVRDHGSGIPAGEHERIFGRFERADSIGHHGGMGLGLYLVREIADAHGGSVSARDADGGGALLEVRLPRAPTNQGTRKL
jgi:PAS domain S-box-containing protein